MNENVKKYLQLGGIVVVVCGAGILWTQLSAGKPAAPAAIAKAEVKKDLTVEPELLPSLEEETSEPETLADQLAKIRKDNTKSSDPYQAQYKPSVTGTELKNAGLLPAPKPKANRGGSTKAGGGGGGGASGGGASGGRAGGGAGGAATGAETSPSPTPETAVASLNKFWLQTGEDPNGGQTPVGTRHNTSCPKYKNVPGRDSLSTEGKVCPICGG